MAETLRPLKMLRPLTPAEREALLLARAVMFRADRDRERCVTHVAIHKDDFDALRVAWALMPEVPFSEEPIG